VGATGGLRTSTALSLGELSFRIYLVLEPSQEALSSSRRRLSDVMAGVLSVGTDAGSE
jgi:hypothetical protein